jgi:transposase-like protein
MKVQVTLGGNIFMAKKGQTFQTYTEEFKLNALSSYVEGSSTYKVVAEREGIRNCPQLKLWVKKWKSVR